MSTGTIFAVYESVSQTPLGSVSDILRTGNDIGAATALPAASLAAAASLATAA